MIKKLRQILANRLVKQVVRVVSKGNPYVLVAVEVYGLKQLLGEKNSK